MIEDSEIIELLTEAAQVGDWEQVDICARALNGDPAAREECDRVVREAAAQWER